MDNINENEINQQPVQPESYQQPVGPAPASEAEKNAFFKSAGSVLMLVVCILSTLSVVFGIIAPILSFDIVGFIFSLLGSILSIVILVGLWITWSNAKKKQLTSTGVKLIKIPYLIQFIFACIGYGVMIITTILGIAVLNMADLDVVGIILIIGLLQEVIALVFTCVIFASLNKTLKVALNINENKSVADKKAGKALAIVLIVYAAISLIFGLVTVILNPLGVVSFISTLISSVYMIIGAVVLLGFAKNINNAHENN